MENKKTILKKEIKKVKPNLYSAEQIKGIRERDDLAKTKKVDMSKAPSPFKMIGRALKNIPGNAKATLVDIPKAKREAWNADQGIKLLKEARGYKGAPDFDEKGVTDAYKTRFMAEELKNKLMAKAAKKKNY